MLPLILEPELTLIVVRVSNLMFFGGTAQDFIFLVLMCSWLSYVSLDAGCGWSVIDLFCGQARISRLAAKLGFRTASVDVKIDGSDAPFRKKKRSKFPGPKRNFMDINGHSGFAFLSSVYGWTCTNNQAIMKSVYSSGYLHQVWFQESRNGISTGMVDKFGCYLYDFLTT